MTRTIPGLSDAEQAMVDRLDAVIVKKARRNKMRSDLMDGKQAPKRLPATASPNARKLGAVLGWPSKAVEHLHRRASLQGFALPGVDIADTELGEIIDANRYISEARLGEQDALVYGCAFEVVTAGMADEPAALISQVSARTATGDWNPRSRRLDSLLSVANRSTSGDIEDATLYLPGETILVMGGKTVAKQRHALHVPAELVTYRPRSDRRFGQSRISRPVIYLTAAAVRSMIRSEDVADLTGIPAFVILGAEAEVFEKGSWDAIWDRINGIPDDEDAANPRAQIQQLTQGNQTPHTEHLGTIAAHFAAETGIPVSSLGVGIQQANPTSSESYIASREDLISEAEYATRDWSLAHVRTLQNAWRVATGEVAIPDDLRRLRPRYRDARFATRAAQADASVKLLGAMPWLGESEAFIETLGFDEDLTARLIEDRRAARARQTIAELMGTTVPTGDEPKEA